MKVSVVIPTFNEESYIRGCLESLMNQSEPPDEIIIVDNNSTDKTVEIASQYPVRVVKEKKQGITHARNAGFNSAKSEIIARADADTVYPPHWVKQIKKHFLNPQVVAVSGPHYQDSKISVKNTHLYFVLTRLFLGHYPLAGANVALTKKIWDAVRDECCNNDKVLHEDVDLGIHLYKKGKIIYDNHLIVQTSARRMRNNPYSYFVDYPLKWIVTMFFYNHKKKSP